MLEVLRWRISIDRNYQVFADEIFHAASQALCVRVIAPQVLAPVEWA